MKLSIIFGLFLIVFYSFQNKMPTYTVLTNGGSGGTYVCWCPEEGKQLEFADLGYAINAMSQRGYAVVTNCHAQGYDQTILVRR